MDSLHVDKTINHFSDDFDAKKLANDVTALKSKQDIYKDDVSAIVEALGIPSAKLNQFIKAYNNPYVYEFADKLIEQTHISLLGDFKDTLAEVTLPNEELEQLIKHCNMLIERNNIEMGGV